MIRNIKEILGANLKYLNREKVYNISGGLKMVLSNLLRLVGHALLEDFLSPGVEHPGVIAVVHFVHASVH